MNITDFEHIFEVMPDMYLLLSPELNIVAVNNEYAKATLTKREQIVGRHLFEVFPDNPNDITADGVSNLRKSLEKVLKSKKPDAMPLQKYDIRTPGTEEFEEKYWSPLNTPVLDENKNVKYIIHRVEDVTEKVREKKRQSEQSELAAELEKTQGIYLKRLRESEEKFRILVERVKEYAIIITDSTGHIQTWNEGAMQIKGYTADEIIGRHISVFYTEEAIRDGEPERNLKSAREKGSFECEGWRLRKDGSRFWADVIYTSLYNEDGKIRGYTKITRDLTEKKRAEENINELNRDLQESVTRLQESEEKFRNVFQGSSVGIAITKLPDFIYTDINEAFVRMTGYAKEELIGHTANEVGLVHNDPNRVKAMDDIRTAGAIKDIELTLHHKSGRIVEVLTSSQTIVLNQQKHSINIIVNITKRKKAEEELLFLNKELEAFTYSVSHDLRAPLRAINGYAQMLEEDYGSSLNQDCLRKLGVIRDNAIRMGVLIDDLLTLSRLGRKQIQKSPVNMNGLVEAALVEVNKTIKHHALIKVADLKPTTGDYPLIYQAMINLLSNAIKYSAKTEKPVIEISSKEKNTEVVYTIKDNGAGFDMQYIDKLFNVFQRLHSADEFEGTGVGLAIVNRIINKHGGKVWAEGKVNEGAAFYFSLPKT